MTHKEFRRSREALGLSVSQYALMLGCSETHVFRLMTAPGADGHRAVNGTMERLINAYLGGYRPPDWPIRSKRPRQRASAVVNTSTRETDR